jgi:signal peptidase I
MQPTLADGDWIILQKRSSMKEGWTPDRYDVVVIDDVATGERLSKRIIGLPNDTVEVKKGVIYLNKRELKDPFGKGKILIYLVDENEKPHRYWETGEWGNAGDPVVEMTSHAEEKIAKGCVWVIGDNRSESWYGILPIKDIKGLAVIY